MGKHSRTRRFGSSTPADYERRGWSYLQPPICHYCGRTLVRNSSNPADLLTVDHAVPYTKGGQNVRENWRMCCGQCNNEKGEMTEEQYLKLRKDTGRHG